MPTKDTSLLELDRVSKVFTRSGGLPVRAVKEVSLTLARGECVGIVGESGSGKSTLARVVSHLTPASGGSIRFQGRDVTRLEGAELKAYYQGVQMIFQDPLGTFSPRMKIGEYMVEPFVNFGHMGRHQALRRAGELLARVGLPAAFLKRYPAMLSGGQLQRVVIARAIGLEPELIICDECTSALDVTIQQHIMDLFAELREATGFASLFISHDLALAESVCDRIHVMYRGEFVESLAGRDITAVATHPYTMELIEAVLSMDGFRPCSQDVG